MGETMAAALGLSPDAMDGDRVTAKVANQNRASFHEKTRNFLYGMASQIFGSAQQNPEMGGEQSAMASTAQMVGVGAMVKPEQAIKNKQIGRGFGDSAGSRRLLRDRIAKRRNAAAQARNEAQYGDDQNQRGRAIE